MATFAIGDVVTVTYPYTDQSGDKLRPALVISIDHHDFLLCMVTSKAWNNALAMPVPEKDLRSSNLRISSFVCPNRLFMANASIINKKIGNFSAQFMREVKKTIADWVLE